MAMIVLSLPDDLAARAISNGLLSSERMVLLLTEELSRLETLQLVRAGSATGAISSEPKSRPGEPQAMEDAQVERANLLPDAELQPSSAEMSFTVKPKDLADALKSLTPHLARMKRVDRFVEMEIDNSTLVIEGESGQRAEIVVNGSGQGRFAVERERLQRVLQTFSRLDSLEFDARGGALSFAGIRFPFAKLPKRRVISLR